MKINACGLISLVILMAGCNFPSQMAPTVTPTELSAPRTPTQRPTPTAPTSTATRTPVGSTPTETALADTPTPTSTSTPPITGRQPVTVTRVLMVDDTSGWGIASGWKGGDQIVRTGHGGETWTLASPPMSALEGDSFPLFAHLTATDENHAWATFRLEPFFEIPEELLVWRTTNNGKDWMPSEPLDLTGLEEFLDLSDFQFSDLDHGWLMAHVGAGMNHDYVTIYHTTNGGQTWQRVADPFDTPDIQGCDKTGMQFLSPTLGWLTSDCQGVVDGAFLNRSLDAGRTWEEVFLPPPASAPDVYQNGYCWTEDPQLFSGSDGMLVLGCFQAEGEPDRLYFIYRTSNGGETWQTYPYPGGELQMLDAREGWALGYDIYRTTDGGEAWTRMKTVSWDGQFSFINMQTGWAVARKGSEIALVKTEDGSRTWQMLEPRLLP